MKDSIDNNTEYGGLVYQRKDETYGVTTNIGESNTAVDVHATAIPEGATAVASWHTPPDTGTLANFSPVDISELNGWKYPSAYLGSHDGNIYHYRAGIPSSGPLDIVTQSMIRKATRVVGYSYAK